MTETAVPVQTVRVDYLCDECGEPMRHSGMVLTSNPPQFPHICKNGHDRIFSVCYPTIRYVEARAAHESPALNASKTRP